MPSELMDQRSLSSICLPSAPLSFFSDELCLPAERKLGFWNKESLHDHCGDSTKSRFSHLPCTGSEGLSLISGSNLNSSFPLRKLCSVRGNSLDCLELTHPYFFEDQKTKINLEHPLIGTERTASLSMTSWSAAEKDQCQSNLSVKPASLFMEGNKVDLKGIHFEDSLFSSSLSEFFDKKSRLLSDDACFSQYVDKSNSNIGKDEPLESLEVIELQTIGHLLPNDDDLLSGVIDNLEYIAQPRSGDDIEDDLFCSGGGIELEADDRFNCKKASNFVGGGACDGQLGELSGLFANEQPFGEHPSRTLLIRNFNSSIDDTELRVLFEQFGDVHMLCTGCKHLGFIMVSYYDIRAAQNAMRTLQNKTFRHWKLDIHFTVPKDNPLENYINQGTLVLFNLDSSVSNDHLCQMFGVYGEIKEIHETPHNLQKKLIEFYDVRAAEAALHALSGSDIAGKKMKPESRSAEATWCLMQQPSLELKQEESCRYRQGSHPSNLASKPYGTIPLLASASIDLDNGGTQDLNSSVRTPIHPSMNSTFPRTSSVVPHSLSSPVRIASAGSHSTQSCHERRHSLGQMNFVSQSSNSTQSGHERSHSLGWMNFDSQMMPAFHPHSLPEHQNGIISGIPYGSSSATSTMATDVNSCPANAVNDKSIHRSGLGGLGSCSFEHIEGGFDVSRDRSFALHGHQCVWNNNNSNQYNHCPTGPVFWPNTPSYLNNFPDLPSPQKMHGLPRAPHMLNTALPLHHYVGSVPATNPSLWDRRQASSGDSLEASSFHPGSLGSLGLAGGSALHPLELDSRNIFPHTGGSCMDPFISFAHAMPSSEQRSHMFPLRNTMLCIPLSYDAPNDRFRSRRSDVGSAQADNKKQFELDIDRIMHREDSRTTLMIKNIPNKYTSKMLLATIDENHRGTYDFLYLPIDFKNKCNVGYAFINMTSAQHIIPFFQTFNGKKWEKFNSEKVASIAYARIQGRAALVAHFQNSSLMNEDKRCRPILFHSDGPNAGEQEPFPVGVNVQSRTGRSKTAGSGGHHLASPSTSSNGEEYSDASDSSSTSTKESD